MVVYASAAAVASAQVAQVADAIVDASVLQPVAEERSGYVVETETLLIKKTMKQVWWRARRLRRRWWKRLRNCLHCQRFLLQLSLLQGGHTTLPFFGHYD